MKEIQVPKSEHDLQYGHQTSGEYSRASISMSTEYHYSTRNKIVRDHEDTSMVIMRGK